MPDWKHARKLIRNDRGGYNARRHFGDALRQTGILAAAGLYAFDHNFQRLREDHLNARSIAEGIAGLPGITLDAPGINAKQCRRATHILVDILTLARLGPSPVPRKRGPPAFEWTPNRS